MQDLKAKTIRGGFARLFAQGANFSLRIVSLMVLARLLGPKEFGLVGMVTAFTGVLNLFRDFGLSTASVQRVNVTEEQMSTLFWINLAVGTMIAVITAVILAPIMVSFYHEPRLFWIACVLGLGFLFNSAGVQHSAFLQRHMRFTALALNDVVALVVSTCLAIVMAKMGYGYWALVAMTVTQPFVATCGLWINARWIPGRPHRRSGIRSMMKFGGTITLNGLIMYVAYNLEKVLLGRFWGAETIGVYGRAYQLATIPTDNLNSAVGEVAFSALSRVQDEPSRLKNYFLKGYSLVTGFTMPITMTCALFANDLIRVFLGPKWGESAVIFRCLAPTILIFAMINPFVWLLFSQGKVGRSLKIALVIAPLVMTGYLIGLHYGPKGVAIGYSTAMAIWLLPHIIWCVHGTPISVWDILGVVKKPLFSGIIATAVAFGLQTLYGPHLSALPRLVLGSAILLSVYGASLLYIMGQKEFYFDLLKGMRKQRVQQQEEKVLVPA